MALSSNSRTPLKLGSRCDQETGQTHRIQWLRAALSTARPSLVRLVRASWERLSTMSQTR